MKLGSGKGRFSSVKHNSCLRPVNSLFNEHGDPQETARREEERRTKRFLKGLRGTEYREGRLLAPGPDEKGKE